MGDQSPQNTMNLDLNLGPVVHPSQDDQGHAMSFEDWLLGSMREVVSNHPRARQRLPSLWRHMPVSMEARNTSLRLTANRGDNDDDDNEQPPETIKTNKNDDKSENGDVGNEDLEKNNEDKGSFFDCNICLDLASEPVVTCCGHLFCWPCLYRWLFVHSDSKECPICKGEVTMKTITPIYSRGNRTHVNKQVVDSNLKIPSRPQANRIESWRQSIQRNTLNIPMFEMIRRLDNRFDLTTDNNPQEPTNVTLLNRIFTSRGMRRGQEPLPAAPDAAAVLPNRVVNLTSAESFVESYERNLEEVPLMEDRHSMSSIAAIIQSESQTGDTAAETDSRVSVSTSSRRRCESSTSRVEDSGESRSRRRRLQ